MQHRIQLNSKTCCCCLYFVSLYAFVSLSICIALRCLSVHLLLSNPCQCDDDDDNQHFVSWQQPKRKTHNFVATATAAVRLLQAACNSFVAVILLLCRKCAAMFVICLQNVAITLFVLRIFSCNAIIAI